MARKKQHLRYQAKKGRLHASTSSVDDTNNVKDTKQVANEKVAGGQDAVKAPRKAHAEFTKLPDSETQFVRKEIVYIGFIALFLLLIYVVIFFVFRFTGVDEWLSGLVKLKN